MMEKLKNKLYKFMYGRYGNDQLNMFLLGLAVVLALINSFFFKNTIVNILVWILLFVEIFRTYSRNIYQRRVENNKFLNLVAPIRKRYSLAKKQSQDKEHKYFICPNCKQSVRVPKGRGKITITCPKCHTKFDRKS